MVLKLKFVVFIVLFFLNSFATNYGEIFYTDKYDANYFSSSTAINSELYIGSDLFRFIDEIPLNTCISFIDSFLTNEKIDHLSNIELINSNTFKIELDQLNAISCYKLSLIWQEKYKIEFQKILHKIIKNIDFTEKDKTAHHIIFNKLIKDESSRFFNSENTINSVNIAFIIPEKISQNDFKKSFTHYNTRRFSLRESQLNTTEILYNETLNSNEIVYSYPSLNRHIFVKSCLGLKILELLLQDNISFKTEYFINQGITNFKIYRSENKIDDFSVFVKFDEISEKEFENLKHRASKLLLNDTQENLFYYSYYDIERLKSIIENYDLTLFNEVVKALNNRKKFIIEVSPKNKFTFLGNKLTEFRILDFSKTIRYRKNSIFYMNENDTTVINKLKLFLEVNKNFNLNINAGAMKSEYLFIEKEKKDIIINKFKEQGYSISRRKDIALYRSLTMFNEFVSSGIDPKRIRCFGRTEKKAMTTLDLFIQD